MKYIIHSIGSLAFMIFLFIPNTVSQENLAHSSPHGIIIFTGSDLHYKGDIVISKGIKNKRKKKLTTLMRVNDRATFMRNIDQFENVLSYLPSVPENLRDSLWERSQDISAGFSYLPNPTLYYLSLGLAYFDDAVEPGETYTYSVGFMRNGQQFETESTPVTYGKISELPQAEYHSAHYEGQSMKTKWYSSMVPTLHSFLLFRQDNSKGVFNRIYSPITFTKTGQDTIFITCYDTTVSELQTFHYFLKGVDLFSNLGPASDTQRVSSFYYGSLPYLKRFRVTNTGENRQLKLSWDFEHKPFIRSIVIERSREFDRDYQQITEVPPTDTTYLDYVAEAHENYYYRLRWTGPDSVSSPTTVAAGHYMGTEVPEPIEDLSASTIIDGVQLVWTDRQPFILGYMVYRSQTGSEEYTQIAQQHPFDTIGGQTFIDTSAELSGLTSYSYYIKTVNDNYLMSTPSDTVQVRPGVTRVLKTPTGLRSRKHEGSVYLMWDDMKTFDPYLLGYEIYRIRLGEDSLSLIQVTTTPETNHFQDVQIVPGAAYGYVLKAFDLYQNKSAMSDTLFVAFPLARPTAPAGLKAFVKEDMIEIRWDEFTNMPDIRYRLYRSVDGGNPEALKTLPSTFDRFQDKDIQTGSEFIYYVTTVTKEGVESSQSETIIIQLEQNQK